MLDRQVAQGLVLLLSALATNSIKLSIIVLMLPNLSLGFPNIFFMCNLWVLALASSSAQLMAGW
jgi:hypothetical protein